MNPTSSNVSTASSTAPTATPSTTSTTAPATTAPGSTSSAGDSHVSAARQEAKTAVDTAADGEKDVMAKIVDSLHGAVDTFAGRVTPVVDRLRAGVDNAGEMPGEWTDAVRTMIREKPIATVAGALVIGAALAHLLSSSKQ